MLEKKLTLDDLDDLHSAGFITDEDLHFIFIYITLNM